MQCRVIVQRYIESALNGAALSGVLLYLLIVGIIKFINYKTFSKKKIN